MKECSINFGLCASFLCAWLFTASLANAQTEMRTWTSSKGTKIEAELLEYENGRAKLQRPNGSTVLVRDSQLSEEDVAFLRQYAEKNDKSDKADKTESDATAEALPPGLKLQIQGISVYKELPKTEPNRRGMFFTQARSSGTTLSFLLSNEIEERTLIRLDEEESSLVSMTDSQKKSLLKQKSGLLGSMGMFGAGPNPVSSSNEDPLGDWIAVDFYAPELPSKGSQFVDIQGKIVVVSGTGEKDTEFKDISLDGKGSFTASGTKVTVKKSDQSFFGGEMKMLIEVTTKGRLDSVFAYTFLNEKGEEIEFQEAGQMWGGIGKNFTITENFALSEKVDKLTIVVSEYETLETLEVPVRAKVDLGQ